MRAEICATNAKRKRLCLNITAVFLGLIALGNPKVANAQYFSGASTAAMGGAGRAGQGTEGPNLNPATLVLVEGTKANYTYRYNSLEEKGGMRDWAVQLVDGTEDRLFQASITYLNSEDYLNSYRSLEDDFILNVGGWVLDGISLGLQAHRYSEKLRDGEVTTIYQVGGGFLWVLNEHFNFGLVAYNVLDDHGVKLRPELAFGSQYTMNEFFRCRLDVVYPTKSNPSKKGIIATGFESTLQHDFHWRLGGRLDDVEKKSYWTTGVSWEGPNLQLAYGFEKDTRTAESIRQSFDIGIQF